MKIFGNLTTEGAEKVEDRLGGSGFSVFDSDVYELTIKALYVGKATQSDARSVTIMGDIDGKEYRETFWVTDKAGNNTYADKKDPKKKHLMPGFIMANDICYMTTEMPLAEQEPEDKVLELYDFEQKANVPTNVPVIVEATGKKVIVAIQRQTVFKQKKGPDGKYYDTAEKRDENTIAKVFHIETQQTLTEAMEGIEGGVFMTKWVEKNKGQTYDRTAGKTPGGANAGQAGRPGAGAGAPNGAPKAKTSLFGSK
jgi:hypothetical protein